MKPDVLVRVVQPHEYDRGDYHQWVTLGVRMKANRLGVSNPRMWDANWTKWICNSGSCAAWALVHDDATRRLLDECAGTPGHRLVL